MLLFGAIALIPAILIIFISLLAFKPRFLTLNSLKELYSLPILFFVLSSGWLFKHSQRMQFSDWDEFTQWGFAVKAMYLFDSLGPLSPAYLNNPGYPPGLSVLAYLVVKIGGSWDEADVFWAYQLLFVSFLLPLLGKFNFRKISYLLISVILFTFASIIFFNPFNTVYADFLLSLFFAYSLYLATDKKTYANRFIFLNLLLVVSTLMLVKDMSIYFVLVLTLLVGLNSFLFGIMGDQARKRLILISILRASLIFLAGYATRFIWLLFVNSGNLNSATSSTFGNSASLVKNTLGIEDYLSGPVTQNFINKILNEPLSRWVAFSPEWIGFPLTTVQWLSIYSALFFLIVFAAGSRISKFHEFTNSLIIVGGAFGYFVVLLISYLSIFSGVNSVILTSVDRYIAIYLSAIVMYLVARAIHQISDFSEVITNPSLGKFENFIPKLAIGITVVFLLQSQVTYLTTYVKKPNEYSDNLRVNYKVLTEKIKYLDLKIEDKVWIISQDTMGFEFYIFQYEVLPASVGSIPFSIGTPSSKQDIWTDPKMTIDKWDLALDDYDYVVMFNSSETFVKEYGDLFEDPESLKEQGIYRVEHSDSGNKLIKHI
jgi:hypothetical protein